ncbi:tRNA (N6-isopentenyl adenosine(37)-C2)-methylthiotransferase MiaB [Heliophilum fasciatum]|uniref:tRNA-2-methylthio-N(6)-dimethylallyladenosine synthase n=1 Tax=Heliophilum fasciatum TaxID=35700 RepID=A0A4R2RF01_9FIRM|nr:tRNA (N6-isopentenyl adenosine(37)-C2)-methylthiotransferase MiaB [Heliophilum fasciatum]MCW2279209.1 tRNA-2-methylthio-N6-dimethylallyladenosine synthase [Heliophilum fasciatum]TCP60998.1 tRNA-i(6)A37 thiotransferase enzyme MiaB [Heliophilum fasciatum]
MSTDKKGFFTLTYGCQMNERDSETLAGFLQDMGYVATEDAEEAAIFLVNSCCVRESAERKILGKIGELRKYKMADPGVIIAVGGCMAQQPHMVEKLRNSYPYVDLIFGTHNLHRLPQMLTECLQSGERVIDVWTTEGEIHEDLPARQANGLKAHVTIMYGCNNFCSYCIVPYVRGRERSRLPGDVIAEITALAVQGVQEVTLLGQNVNSYGKDLENPLSFADLLRQVGQVEGIKRVRFMTSHPKDVEPELIAAMAEVPALCPHIHLPVQAGSDRILRAMNRYYTRQDYLLLLGRLRAAVPHLAVTTDIIVGFPGETDEDFADTLDLVRKAQFDHAFTFLYSKRSGTPAAELPEQIDGETKRNRFQQLLALQNEISLAINQRLLGQVVDVLVEGRSKNDATRLTGRTGSNKIVVFPGDDQLIGQTVAVKINEVRTWTLLGEQLAK